MTQEEFKKLNTGDVVGSKFSQVSYIVTQNYGDRVTVVRTSEITNPEEWDLLTKCEQNPQRL